MMCRYFGAILASRRGGHYYANSILFFSLSLLFPVFSVSAPEASLMADVVVGSWSTSCRTAGAAVAAEHDRKHSGPGTAEVRYKIR